METFRFMDLVGGREDGRKGIGQGGGKDTNKSSVAMSSRLQRDTQLSGKTGGHALIWMSSNIWVVGMM